MLENGKSMPSVDAWLREAKADVSAADCGMYLTHNGVVRATPKAEVRGVETDGVAPGHKVGGMVFGFDAEKVQAAIEATRTMPGIGYVRVWLAHWRRHSPACGRCAAVARRHHQERVRERGRARGVRPRRQSESVYSESPPAVHVDLPAGFDVLELFCSGVCYTRVASLGLMVIL